MMTKKYKGYRGLKIHCARNHKDKIGELATSSHDVSSTFKDVISEYKQHVRVLKRIPKGARMTAANKLSSLIDVCTNENSFQSWCNLMSFTFIALRIPEKTPHTKSLTTEVKRNITQFDTALFRPNNREKKPTTSRLRATVEHKVSEGDIRGAVKILSSQDQLAPQSETIRRQLEEKHPAPSRSLSLPDPPEENAECVVTNTKEVLKAILTFPNGSASGVDGLRPQHLKDMLAAHTGDAGSRLLTSVTTLCNTMLAGKVNEQITEILYGATLCALTKKDGGVRPIAVGNTFRRLVAKLGCAFYREPIGDTLRPRQLGFATKGGCEIAVHATRSFLEHNKNSSKVLLKIDFKNAFNSVERDKMLTAVHKYVPKLYKFLWQCYSSPSILFFGQHRILSQVGAQQGDPAGPMAFSISIQSILEDLRSELNVFYLDDGTIAGEADTVVNDFENIISKCAGLGLEINPSKCEIHFCSTPDSDVIKRFQSLSPGIRVITENLSLLGAPLSTTSLHKIMEQKCDELQVLFSRLPQLHNHIAFYLLRHCFAIPKLTYLLRTAPLWKHPDILKRIDHMVLSTMEKIANTRFDSSQWEIASLPVKHGGLGLRRAQDIALPAFLASINSVFSSVKLMLPNFNDITEVSYYSDAIQLWNFTHSDASPELPTFQQNWDCIQVTKSVHSITNTLISPQAKARFVAAQTSEASAWLTVLPSRQIGTLLDDNCFRISVALRLGCIICTEHKCICGSIVDEFGTHGLSCVKSGGRRSRHSAINDILHRALATSQIPSILEPPGMTREDGKRPDGMTLVPWSKGQPLVWDATCTDTLAPSHIEKAMETPGIIAENAAAAKRRKYKTIIDRGNHFIPFAVETLGPWSEDARTFIQDLGARMTLVTGDSRSKHYLTQRISIAIQRGNAASVIGTFPPNVSLEEIYLLS